MSELEWYHIIWAAGALVLAGGALASYQLSWSKALRYALIWFGIFAAVTLLFDLVGS